MKMALLVTLIFSGFNCFAATGPDAANPPVSQFDITAPGVLGNRLPACHLVGQITEWATQSLNVWDVTGQPLGAATVGLAQFESGARLEGCAPGNFKTPNGTALSLEHKFVNFIVADNTVFNGDVFDSASASAVAARLGSGYYQLAEKTGAAVPLVSRLPIIGVGSISFKFTIVLIKNGSHFDAVVYRETTGTKFAPHLSEEDRRRSQISWRSIK
jgi:hypothetical protein